MLESIIKTYRQTGFLHHAHLIVGEREIIHPVFVETLKAIGSEAETIWENYETFGVDESRGLIERSARHNWSGKREFVVLAARRYTPEAQNALLKLFEEPRSGLHFFLIGGRVTDFLPTLRSRLMIVENQEENKLGNEAGNKQASQFLSATPVDRLTLIAGELKKEQPREAWLLFLNALEAICYEIQPLPQQSLVEIMTVRKYLTDPASLPRLLFEHLAFVLPRVVESKNKYDLRF